MNKKSIARRIERYFKIASLVCSCCGEFTSIFDRNGNVVESLEDYGIHTKEEWETEMEKEIIWIKRHEVDVLSILPDLHKEWPESCKSLRMILTMTGGNLN